MITKDGKEIYADKQAYYWWKMTMNPDQKRRELKGYGAIEGHRQNQSKIQNLMRCVEMLYTNGYFYKTSKIVFYEKLGAIACEEIDTIVLVITPDSWTYLGNDYSFSQFINNFRAAITKGVAPAVHMRPITQADREERAHEI